MSWERKGLKEGHPNTSNIQNPLKNVCTHMDACSYTHKSHPTNPHILHKASTSQHGAGFITFSNVDKILMKQ